MTTNEQTKSKFIYSDIYLIQHSSNLSFNTLKIEINNNNNFNFNLKEKEDNLISSYYLNNKRNEHNNLNNNLNDGKIFFMKAYGKKDMFSKEIKIENKIPKSPVIVVNLEETLLQVSSNENNKPSTPTIIKNNKKSALGNLFGDIQDDEINDTTPPPIPTTPIQPNTSILTDIKPQTPQINQTFNGFDSSFNAFTTPPPPIPTNTNTSNNNNTNNNTGFLFDAFSTPAPPSNTGFDAFAGFDSNPTITTNKPSFGFDFDAFDSNSTSLPPLPPPSIPIPQCDITPSLTCYEELLCLYKNSVIDKFQITGSLQYQYTINSSSLGLTNSDNLIEDGTQLITSLKLIEKTKKFQDIIPLTSQTTLEPRDITSNSPLNIQSTISFDQKQLTTLSTTSQQIGLIKYLVVPTYRPEYLRTRMNIVQKDVIADPNNPDIPSTHSNIIISIQLLLNKNYSYLSYEGIQLMCSLQTLPEITAETLKYRPNALFSFQSKVITWKFSQQNLQNNSILNMECSLLYSKEFLASTNFTLPSQLPIIVKCLMSNNYSIISDYEFKVENITLQKDNKELTNIKLNKIESNTMNVKSKIEYRFM